MHRGLVVLFAAGCGSQVARPTTPLRTACADTQYHDGTGCRPRGDATAKLAAGQEQLEIAEIDAATAAIDAAEQAGPLTHTENITLWKLRGLAAAYVDDAARARAAFEKLIALDPLHILSYETSPKATHVFEAVRTEAKDRGAPAVDVNWSVGQKVGTPVPLALTVVADPLQFLRRATLYVRTRGETQWRSADVALGEIGVEQRVVLPPVNASRSVSLEVFLRAYDDRGNEVLTWAEPSRPREIPLRYDPPKRWWQTWWGITLIGGVAVAGTGAVVYGVTREPPDRVPGMVGTVSSP